ncbi:MAG: RNA polymerase-binding protein DksA [Steroidobacteraceae bacterium]
MSAKKLAPKPVKGKRPASRAAPRKAAARKPPERAKPVSHARLKAASSVRKGVPAPAAPARATGTVNGNRTEATELMRTAGHAQGHAQQPARVEEAARASSPPAAAKFPPAVHARVQPLAGGTDADDAEAAEPGSLLAGPRNVKPYIARRGEQYMSKEQTEHFRNILLSWKRDLMVEVDRTVTHMKDEAANFPDPNDRATQEEEFSLELRTRDRERKLIRKIDEALKRIEDGTYGYCLETGEEIGVKRLEARPVATLSIEAQERRERRERQYGDRDDRYR